ncbi:MAG: efflux transporter periplasmic adaptor subunit, partial [Pseudomonas sp. PGPPP4]
LSQVLVIPANAVQRGSQGVFVYVLDADNRVSMRTVTLGVTAEERLQVLTGLEAGERVVTEGGDRLRDGMQVKVAGSDSDKAAAKPPAKPVETKNASGAGA